MILWPPSHGLCDECKIYKLSIRDVTWKSSRVHVCYNCWFEFFTNYNPIDHESVMFIRSIWDQQATFQFECKTPFSKDIQA